MTLIYTGIFLVPDDRRTLLAACPPKYEVVYADHVTHLDQPNPAKLRMDSFGKLYRVRVKELYDDGQLQAARVEFTSTRLVTKGWTAHIALSGRKSISPRYAKEMLKGASQTGECPNLTVFGVYAPFYEKDVPACAPDALCGVCHRCALFTGPLNNAYTLYAPPR